MYLRIDEGFEAHCKTLKFCRLMQNPEAGIYLMRLWTWAVRSAPNGDLTEAEAYDVEVAVRYRLLDGKCFAAMIEAGFIDVDEETGKKSIHKWLERTGGDIASMESESCRKKAMRAHRAQKCAGLTGNPPCDHCVREMSAGRSADGPRTVQVLAADKTTQTRPVQTRPDQSTDPERAPDPASPPQKPTGYHLQTRWGQLRAALLGGLPWDVPGDPRGEVAAFASRLMPDAAVLVEPSMRLALERIRDRRKGWDDERLREPAFGFGAWRSKFTSLCEEIIGQTPKTRRDPGEVHYPTL